MKVEIKIDNSLEETMIIVMAPQRTEELDVLLKKLSEDVPEVWIGSRNGKLEVLEQKDLIRIYANMGRVYAETSKGEYVLRFRLYEVEERLNGLEFIRISNSEIINLKKVSSFDLSFAGTICVKMKNGIQTFVSRRYVSKIKKVLGMRG